MDRIRLIHTGTLSCEPILRRMPDGSLLCVFQRGDVTEPAPENRVYYFHSHDNGESWTKAQSILPEDGNAVYCTEVMLIGGEATAFITLHNGRFLNWKNLMLKSNDSGNTWHAAGPPPFFPGFAFMRGKIGLLNGEVMIAYQHYPISPGMDKALRDKGEYIWSADIGFVETGVIVGNGQGGQYTRHTAVKTPVKGRGQPQWAWTEPTIAQLGGGRVVMLLSVCESGFLWQCESGDNGRNWTKAVKTDIPNPSNKPKLVKLPGGRVALIHTPNPAHGFENRNPLAIWISGDGMQSWPEKIYPANFPGYYCYPDGFYDEETQCIMFTIEYNRHDVLFFSCKV